MLRQLLGVYILGLSLAETNVTHVACKVGGMQTRVANAGQPLLLQYHL